MISDNCKGYLKIFWLSRLVVQRTTREESAIGLMHERRVERREDITWAIISQRISVSSLVQFFGGAFGNAPRRADPGHDLLLFVRVH